MAAAFYTTDGDRFVPSELTRGPWDPHAQHAGPPAALLGRELERCEPPPGAQISRVTFEILGPVPLAPLRTHARIVRPGRSVELLEGTIEGPDGPVIRASAWRLRTDRLDLDSPPPDDDSPPGPDEGVEREFFATGSDVGYHTAMEYRFTRGAFLELGPATVWMRMRQPLVDGEQPSGLQRLLAVADTGNGASAAIDFHRFLFINTDLTVNVLRPPQGEWVCLDAVTHVGDHGIGLTESALWDERGRVGAAAQTLLIRPR